MREQRRWRWLFAVLALVAFVGAAGCGDDDEGEDKPAQQARKFPAGTTMAKLQKEGEIAIGVKFDVPPFGVKNPQSGDIEGFDVDLGKAIAQELGVKPRLIEAVSDNRIPFLEKGTADLILSTMTINKERDTEVDFSEPYYIARGRILVPKGSDIKGLADLDGKKVCTALGSTYADTLKEKAKDADLKLVDTYSECLELLQNKSVDAVSTDDVILTGMIIQDPDLRMVGRPLTTEPYGAGIKQGDRKFKEFVDGVVRDYKSDGRWARSYQKWVGRYTKGKQDPPTISLQEALKVSG
jgi:glutamate transport system substrate-binding protein